MKIKAPHIPFIKNKIYFLIISAVLITVSIFYTATKGLNYGIDFKGGVKLQYRFSEAVLEGTVKNAIDSVNLGDLSVQRFGDLEENRMVIKIEKPEAGIEHVAPIITEALIKAFGAEKFMLEQEETVGPKVGSELRKKGILAVLAALALILIYVGFRFDFMFAPGAVVALIHDVIVTVGIFSFMQKEFNLAILAALLTIVGYSLNDTIVIFDRVRENAKDTTTDGIDDVVNVSINETLSRTIITSLTTLLVVVILFLMGGGTLHDFAFALIIGVVAGTYSTIFIASPTYIFMYKMWPKLAESFGWDEK
ncbi:protein translocase subunit SecF [bacterium]|nr:protein translocase subunit SecF [bacterium]